MNLAIRGIEADLGRYNADTFFNDCHPTLKADFVMANPPFNLSDWGADKLADEQLRIVHQIAELLGETAADTKVAVEKLKETILTEQEKSGTDHPEEWL